MKEQVCKEWTLQWLNGFLTCNLSFLTICEAVWSTCGFLPESLSVIQGAMADIWSVTAFRQWWDPHGVFGLQILKLIKRANKAVVAENIKYCWKKWDILFSDICWRSRLSLHVVIGHSGEFDFLKKKFKYVFLVSVRAWYKPSLVFRLSLVFRMVKFKFSVGFQLFGLTTTSHGQKWIV